MHAAEHETALCILHMVAHRRTQIEVVVVALQDLVACKMQLAELNETYLSTCHELHKSKEKNLAIAGKMTK